MSLRKFSVSLIFAGALLVSGAANAAVVSLEFAGFANGSRSGTTTVAGEIFNNVSAGQFVFKVTNIDGDSDLDIYSRIVAFCIEANVTLEDPSVYEVISASAYFTPEKLETVEQLFSQYLGYTGTRDTDAAFQLALWEIIYDGSFDLSSGVFIASGFGDALGIAQGWLDDLLSSGTFPNLWALRAPGEGVEVGSQDLITWQVPEPGSLALLGVGLIAFGAMRRRKIA